MGAGGSDFGAVPLGGIGQGFSQGAAALSEQLERERARKKAEEEREKDRKIAAANYTSETLMPLVTKMSEDLPPPGFDASPEEWDRWESETNRRATNLPALTGSLEKALKQINPELDSGVILKALGRENPAEYAQGLITRAAGARNFRALEPTRKALEQSWAQATSQFGANSAAATAAKQAYEEFLQKGTGEDGTGPTYKDVYKSVFATDYIDSNVDGTNIARLGEQDTLKKATWAQLTTLAAQNPVIAAVVQQLGSSDKLDLSKPIVLPNGQEVNVSQLVKSSVDVAAVTAMAREGRVKDVVSAVLVMDPTQRSTLPQEVQTLMADISDPEKVKNNPAYSAALAEIKIAPENLKLVTAQASTAVFNLDTARAGANRKNAAEFTTAAKNGDSSVLNYKADFLDTLPANYTPEQAEEAWQRDVVTQLNSSKTREQVDIATRQASLEGLDLNNSGAVAEQVTSGNLFLLTAKDEKGQPIASGPLYEKFLVKYKGNSQLAEQAFRDAYDTSRAAFDRKTEGEKTQLLNAQVTYSRNAFDLKQAETVAPYVVQMQKAQAQGADLELEFNKAVQELKIPGAKAQLFQDLAVKMGPDWVNSDAAKKIAKEQFGNSAAGVLEYAKGVSQYDVWTRDNPQRQTKLAEFDRFLQNPRMAAGQLGAVKKLATELGLSPLAASQVITDLAVQEKDLTNLQRKKVIQDMWAQSQGVQLNREQFIQSVRSDERNYNRGVFESDRGYEFNKNQTDFDNILKTKQMKLSEFNAEFDMVTKLASINLQERELNSNEQLQLQQIKVNLLQPTQIAIQTAQAQRDVLMQQEAALLKDDQRTSAAITTKLQKNSQGLWVAISTGVGQVDNKLNQIADMRNQRDEQNNIITNGQGILKNVVSEFTTKKGNTVGDVTELLFGNYEGSDIDGGGPGSDKVDTSNKRFSAKALRDIAGKLTDPRSRAVADALLDVTGGKLTPEMSEQGYCSRFVRLLLNKNFDPVKVRAAFGASARESWGNFKEMGLMVDGGKQLTVKNIATMGLKPGDILFQDSDKPGKPGVKDPSGHVAILGPDGLVYQNSYYGDTKIGGNVGAMSLEAYVKAFPTFVGRVPDEWANAKYQTGNAGTGGGTTTPAPTVKPKQTYTGGTPSQYVNQAGVKYGDANNNFAPRFNQDNVSSFGRVVSSSVPRGPIQIPQGNRFVVVDDPAKVKPLITTAYQQFAQWQRSLPKGSDMKIDGFGGKMTPKQQGLVVKLLSSSLKTQGWDGDLDKYVKDALKFKY